MAQPKGTQTLFGFVEHARAMSRSEYLKGYPDPVLLAMGVLKTEEIRARCGSTTEMSVSKPATHSTRETHPLAGRLFFIPIASRPAGSLFFGREEPADIVVPDETVSTRHCVISWDDGTVNLTDAGSTNGTLVNLQPLRPNRPAELLNEDIITVGRHSFQFYLAFHFHRVLESLAMPLDS